MKVRILAAALPLLVGAVIGCDLGVVHTFYAIPYDVTLACLKSSEPADIIDGPDPGKCAEAKVHCWVSPLNEIYVSDVACEKPRDFLEQNTGPCRLALKALKNKVFCADRVDGGDGGS